MDKVTPTPSHHVDVVLRATSYISWVTFFFKRQIPIIRSGGAAVSVVVLAFSLFTFAAKADELPPAAKALFADRQNMTEFTLVSDNPPDPGETDVEVKVRVPNIYINREYTEPGSRPMYLNLKMLWPTMEGTTVHLRPRRGDDAGSEERQRLFNEGRLFQLQLMKGRWDRSATMLADHIKNDWVPFSRDPQVPGFTKYASKIVDRLLYPLSQYLVPTDTSYTYPVFFQCPVGNSLPHQSLGCVGHNYLGHHVYGEYQFPFSDLDHWKEIDMQVRALFEAMLET